MAAMWSKLKKSLGLKLFSQPPQTSESPVMPQRPSDLSAGEISESSSQSMPSRSSSALSRFSRSFSTKSSK
ncbi:unnamed protein product, partial [Ilex paraguariensis]